MCRSSILLCLFLSLPFCFCNLSVFFCFLCSCFCSLFSCFFCFLLIFFYLLSCSFFSFFSLFSTLYNSCISNITLIFKTFKNFFKVFYCLRIIYIINDFLKISHNTLLVSSTLNDILYILLDIFLPFLTFIGFFNNSIYIICNCCPGNGII